MILNLKSRVAYVLAVVLVVLLGITQVAPACAERRVVQTVRNSL